MSGHSIYHCEVRSDNQALERGHWFFHTGQWAICAGAARIGERKWQLEIYFQKAGKKLLSEPQSFRTLAQAKEFLAEYFEQEIVRTQASSMPTPDDL